MLAKELKIANLRKQREFIAERLNEVKSGRDDGDVSYRYAGYIFPEVIEYFKIEGFEVIKHEPCVETGFMPITFFVPINVKLESEELKQAENFGYGTGETAEDYLKKMKLMNQLDDFLGGMH